MANIAIWLILCFFSLFVYSLYSCCIVVNINKAWGYLRNCNFLLILCTHSLNSLFVTVIIKVIYWNMDNLLNNAVPVKFSSNYCKIWKFIYYILNYDANHFRNKTLRMLLVLELASFNSSVTSTCYLSAFVLLLTSRVCTCQSSYFSVSTF